MSDYQRIREAISHYENLARFQLGEGFVGAATAQFADLQAKYYSKTENPDYSSNIKKFCYLYKYSVAHGYYIFTVLKRLRPKIKPAIFSRSPTKIACIGGGPGTEIIGLCRYLRTVEPENLANSIEITVFDKEPSWKDSCERVLGSVRGDLNIKLKFVEFDATDPGTYKDLDFSMFVMVMANFFISEIRRLYTCLDQKDVPYNGAWKSTASPLSLASSLTKPLHSKLWPIFAGRTALSARSVRAARRSMRSLTRPPTASRLSASSGSAALAARSSASPAARSLKARTSRLANGSMPSS